MSGGRTPPSRGAWAAPGAGDAGAHRWTDMCVKSVREYLRHERRNSSSVLSSASNMTLAICSMACGPWSTKSPWRSLQDSVDKVPVLNVIMDIFRTSTLGHAALAQHGDDSQPSTR